MNASKKIRVIAALGTLSGAVWAGTFATFSDTGASTTTFTSGTVDLKLDGADSTSFTSLSMTNLKPGQSVVAPLTVSNPTSTTALPFGYTMSTAVTNLDGKGLGTQLRLKAAKVADIAACTAAAVDDVAFTTAYTAAGSDVIADGTLAAAAMTSRTIAAGGSHVWCFKVTMPNGTPTQDNPFQGALTTATMTFTASQL